VPEVASPGPLDGRGLIAAGADSAAHRAARLLQALGADPAGDGRALHVAAAEGSGPVSDWAASGGMQLTGRAGGPPLVAPGEPATAARAAVLALEALVGRRLGVEGHHLLGERAALAGLRRRAPWSVGGSCRAVRTRDGWVAFSLARPSDADLLPALVEDSAGGEPWQVVEAWSATRPAAAVVERAQLLGLVAAEVDEQPRPVWPPWRVTSSGERRSGVGRPTPLVVDLSALWAGPLCAHLLGLAGAEVVRVESRTRPDGGRAGSAAFDDLLHANQPSVALDLHESGGQARLRALVARADVVVTSARPRALEQLGLDPAAHLASRADGVWVAVTGHPSAGAATRLGFGDDAAMSAGLVRWLDGVPVPCGDALGDPLAGVHAAVAAQAGIDSGGRHLVEVALSTAVRSTMHEVQGELSEAFVERGRWQVQSDGGQSVEVRPPRARKVPGQARPLGADTAAVLSRLGI
jgi:hypothetical protein